MFQKPAGAKLQNVSGNPDGTPWTVIHIDGKNLKMAEVM
jgi:hypothetical protein